MADYTKILNTVENDMAEYIGEYRIIKEISGESNMSQVFLCIDDSGFEYAIKLFNKFDGDENSRKLQETIFNREVEILQKISHQNIVKYITFGQDNHLQKYYIALEYINGKNLKDALPTINAYNEYEKLELINQILAGVEYLHKKNIIHRDLKPSNIMLDENGVAKVIDFGISKYSATHYNDYTVFASKTLPYCSPEQEENKEATNKSDIYSLGLIFYEIFTGEKYNKLNGFNTAIFEILPLYIQDLLAKMLKKEPTLRYGSIGQIIREISIIKNNITQMNFLVASISNSAISKLFQNNYIAKNDKVAASELATADLNKECYIMSCSDKKTGNISYKLIGRRLIFICKKDKYNKERLIIVDVHFENTADILDFKEKAYEIPYKVRVLAFAPKNANEIPLSIIINELEKHEYEICLKNKIRWHNNEIIDKWGKILSLQRKRLIKEKSALSYNDFKVINDEYLEVYLESEISDDDIVLKFKDNLLQMSTKRQKSKSYNVGYMRDCINGILIIELAADTDTSIIASIGEVSINMDMADIALRRQEQAMRHIQFRECANPIISDIIFNPASATATIKEPLTINDCHSNKIDNSKLRSLEKALGADNLFLLQGPPGTGKTTFISELVCQILDRKPDSKILITSQSHVAVDHSLTQIKELIPDINMIRIGRKEKFSEKISNYSIDSFLKEWTQKVNDCCEKAIKRYEKEIGLDTTLQEKVLIISEIEKLQEKLIQNEKELQNNEIEKNSIAVLSKKWEYLTDKINEMKKQVISGETYMSNYALNDLMNSFISSLESMNQKLKDAIEESIKLSEKLYQLEKRNLEIKESIEQSGQDISDWKDMLNISDNPTEFEKYKQKILEKTKENQIKYNEFSKISSLCAEWKSRIQKGDALLQESLFDATLVGATCLGIASLKIDYNFDWVIIDEAGKSTPTEVLVPICLGKKIILVGDHKQLPPIVDEAILEQEETGQNVTDLSKSDLETSLFEYMEGRLNDNCKSILNEQYRMHPTIGKLISTLFYPDTPLISKTKVEEKTIPLKMYDNKALIWLSTCNKGDNAEERIKKSYRNRCEAKLIFQQLCLIDKELNEQDLYKKVAIIAGYKEQKSLINQYYTQYKKQFNNITSIEIDTVDAFQGNERDIVFYSIVRSNERGNIGFLKDIRRLNVAFSRAKELLIVVGNHQCTIKMSTFSNGQSNPFMGVVQFIHENKDYCKLEEVE